MDKFFQIIEEEIELAKNRTFARIKRMFKDGNQNSNRTNTKLKFRNRISRTILTGDEIKGEGNTPIEVVLVDDPTGNIVDVGPEASASVEIVVLKGESGDNWTVKEFNDNIVPVVEGKRRPLLAGNVELKLQRGIGVLDNIRFRHHASKIKPPVFKLGARVVDASDWDRIREAKTESFTVKDFRNKYYRKHETPSLSDEVWRLKNIGKGGKIDKRLRDNKIYTVEDFLIQLLIDPEGLKTIVNLPTKKWEDTVNKARACPSDIKKYFYMDSDKKIGVVFNVLGQVLGLYLENRYSPTSFLSENYKVDTQELLASACKHWSNVKPFDDMDSLEQHLASLSTSLDPLDYPGRGYEYTGTEMIGESSSRYSNFSYQSTISTMNSIGDTGGEDFDFFSIAGVEIYGAGTQLNPDSTFDPANFEGDFERWYNMEVNGLINESNDADVASGVSYQDCSQSGKWCL